MEGTNCCAEFSARCIFLHFKHPNVCLNLSQILLGYLPRHRDEWEGSLAKSRKLFKEFIQELVIDPRKAASVQADHVRSSLAIKSAATKLFQFNVTYISLFYSASELRSRFVVERVFQGQ
jgi:hypothetical protein